MTTTYIINFTDTVDKPSFVIQPYTTNGTVSPTTPTLDSHAVSANTSLLLFGKGMPDYGVGVQQDIIHLLENFSGPVAPVLATKGQLWFDTSVVPNQLKIFDGTSFVSSSANYVLKSGDTMTGLLVLSADPVVAMGAATKQYVDAVQTNLTTHTGDTTLHLTTNQNTFLDGLNLPTLTATEVNYLVGVTSSVQTQFTGKLSKSGDAMTGGFLTLFQNPTSNLHAATKQYVDTVVVGAGGSTLSSGTFDPTTYTLTLNSTPPSSINVNIQHSHAIQTYNAYGNYNYVLNGYYSDKMPVITANTGLSFFEINDDFTLSFTNGLLFFISGSTGNDGAWTVSSSTFSSGKTQIYVTTAIPSAVADGIITISGNPTLSLQHGFDGLDAAKAPANNAILTGETRLESHAPILAVTSGLNGTFTIDSNLTSLFVSGYVFAVDLSSGNNGPWVTLSSAYSAPNTIITVTGTVPSAVADGIVILPQQPSSPRDATPKEYVDNKTSITRSVQTGAGTTTPKYTIGANNLWVFVNGIKWYLGDGYTETTSTSITWVTSPSGSDRVEFLVMGK
jgi:hypothetical protein